MCAAKNTSGNSGSTAVDNYYPELPVIAYKHTTITMAAATRFAKTLISTYGLEAVRTTYCIFRNESGNGSQGVNNNYAGLQADVGRWDSLTGAIATCLLVDSVGDERRFICFSARKGYKISFEFTCSKVVERNMYIGAPGVNNSDDLVQAYFDKWVADPKEFTQDNIDNFKQLYNQSLKTFKSI